MDNEEQRAAMIAHKRRHPNHKVVETFGGWGCGGSMTEDCTAGTV